MALTFLVDNVAMTLLPSGVVELLPDPEVYQTAAGGQLVGHNDSPGMVEVRFGMEASRRDWVAELQTKRGRALQHVISYRNAADDALIHRNVYIPEVRFGRSIPSPNFVDPTTFTMPIVTIWPQPLVLEMWYDGTLTTGDGKVKVTMPAGGRILKIEGWIHTLGTGSGQTRIQVSNGATDYLTTRGDFVVASASNLMESQALAVSPAPTFQRGEELELDVDDIPSGANSAGLQVLIYAALFKV